MRSAPWCMVSSKPIVNRFFVVLTWGTLWALAASAQAGPPTGAEPMASVPLSEAQAVARTLGRPALEALVRSEVALAEAAAIERGLWPNPEVGYGHDQVFGSPHDEMEQAVVLSQRFDLARRRGLLAEAGEMRARSAAAGGESLRLEVAAEARRRFYQVLHSQGRHAVISGWIERLGGAHELVAHRKAAGDASRYERHRLERELRAARAELAAEGAARDAAWLRLAALMGEPATPTASWPRVRGRLLPSQAEPAAIAPLGERADLRALELEAQAAQIELEAAERGWVPELGLSAGWRSVAAGDERRHGFAAELSLSLPIFDHGQGAEARARALGQQARARRELRLQSAAGELAAARTRLRALIRAAQRFRQDSSRASAALVRMAEQGYGGGELELLELLDAHRAAVEDELRALELELAARHARIDLDRALGGTPP